MSNDSIEEEITKKVKDEREATKLRARVALDKMMKEWRAENEKKKEKK